MNTSQTVQFNTICRVCLLQKNDMQALFEYEIVNMIVACATVQIEKGDGLPERICEQCMNLLNWSYFFKTQCEKADQILRLHLKQNGDRIENHDIKNISLQILHFPHLDICKLPDFNIANNIVTDIVKDDSDDIAHDVDIEYDKDIKLECDPDEISNSENYYSIKTESNDKTENSPINSSKRLIANKNETKKKTNKKQRKTLKSKIKKINKAKELSKAMKDYIRCKECRMRFILESDLEIHMIAHSENHNNTCSICSETCTDIRSLRKHLAVHMQNKPFFYDKVHLCTICGKGFGYPKLLAVHMRQHSGEKPYQCTECGKHFVDTNNLQMHKRFKHKGDSERKHICETCNKAFYTKKLLKDHLVVHTKEKPYSCMVCSKSFTQAQYVKIHMRKHTGDWPLSCTECGMGFTQQSKLEVHMRTHTGSKPHMCDVCGRGFAQSFSLKVHMSTHTGNKPYACPECPLRCATKTKLESHMRKHTGIHPYLCPTCGKSFAWRQNLTKHIFVHTGEKPFECTVCEHKFSDPSSLSKHKKTHGDIMLS